MELVRTVLTVLALFFQVVLAVWKIVKGVAKAIRRKSSRPQRKR